MCIQSSCTNRTYLAKYIHTAASHATINHIIMNKILTRNKHTWCEEHVQRTPRNAVHEQNYSKVHPYLSLTCYMTCSAILKFTFPVCVDVCTLVLCGEQNHA